MISLYRSKTYSNDFSGFVGSIDDFGNKYNEKFKLK